MDLTDIPDGIQIPDGDPPEFGAWEAPEEVLKGGSTKERLLDVVLQRREPTKVSTIADWAECDPETARDYLAWFAEMGMVRERAGRPIRYERNESYLRWRRIERIRSSLSADEIVAELTDVLDAIEEFRERFDADSPNAVSLVEASRETAVEEAWEALSMWQTLERRAALLDAARRDERGTSRPSPVDA